MDGLFGNIQHGVLRILVNISFCFLNNPLTPYDFIALVGDFIDAAFLCAHLIHFSNSFLCLIQLLLSTPGANYALLVAANSLASTLFIYLLEQFVIFRSSDRHLFMHVVVRLSL